THKNIWKTSKHPNDALSISLLKPVLRRLVRCLGTWWSSCESPEDPRFPQETTLFAAEVAGFELGGFES
ncbi:MAG: hypothetical protein ACK5PB_03900, partial [Pirellula sp.]